MDGNCVVDITTIFDKKLKALSAHASQVDIEAVRGWLDEAVKLLYKKPNMVAEKPLFV